MDRQRISSGATFEQRVGYSRAVRVGTHVWVSGTAPIMPGDGDPPDGAYEQAKVCLEIIGRALEEAGATFDDVVRTRIYVTTAADIEVPTWVKVRWSRGSPAMVLVVVVVLPTEKVRLKVGT